MKKCLIKWKINVIIKLCTPFLKIIRLMNIGLDFSGVTSNKIKRRDTKKGRESHKNKCFKLSKVDNWRVYLQTTPCLRSTGFIMKRSTLWVSTRRNYLCVLWFRATTISKMTGTSRWCRPSSTSNIQITTLCSSMIFQLMIPSTPLKDTFEKEILTRIGLSLSALTKRDMRPIT